MENLWTVRCAVVMPDHVHLLFTLGERLSLGKCVARLKAKTAGKVADAGLTWERDFFEHRIRPDECRTSVFLYVYLNPYRAGLVPPTQAWPWYFCRDSDWEWFRTYLDAGLPEPDWLRR